MKLISIFGFVLMLLIVSCERSDLPASQCSVQARWIHPLGTVLYEFNDSLRYTIYQTVPGQFGTIADAIPNPEKWWLEGDTLILKLGTNSFQKAYLEFDCNCNLMKLTSSFNQSTWTTRYWKEGADSTICQ